MRWIRRGRSPLLPLQLPRLDGTSWPDRREVRGASFAASTLHQLGYREAFEPKSHDITDLILDQILPLVLPQVAPEDEPYLRRLFASAAQLGAGIGHVERAVVADDRSSTDRGAAGALLIAADELSAMPDREHAVARYLMQCGYYLARTDVAELPLLVAALAEEADPGFTREI